MARSVKKTLEVFKTSRVWLLLFLLLGLLARPARAETPAWETLFAEAERLYAAGQYAEAAARYEQIIQAGGRDGSVYYNLGNAYYKAGQLGEAILNYERARRLLPRDDDVRANLAFALSQVQGGPALPPAGDFAAAVTALHESLTASEKAWLAWGLYLLVCLLGLAGLFLRRWRRPALSSAGAAGVVLLVVAFSWALTVRWQEGQDRAIVTAAQAPAYSGPGESYMLEMTLGEGNAVVVEERRGGWCRLVLAGDLQGWTPCANLTSVWSAPAAP
jgi:tetratricopeptide (TPR) repeat protein